MKEKIKINYKFSWLTEFLEEDVKKLIDNNLEWKMDWYLRKALSKSDTEMHISVRINKNKQERYEWSFEYLLDWDKIMYTNDVPFKNILDLVNHAFDHLKRQLSDRK